MLQYLSMKDLDSKIYTRLTQRCLSEIKQALPEPQTMSMERIQRKICKIVKNSDKEEISNIIKDERPQIREFVLSGTHGDTNIPVRIANVICKYLEEKTL